MSPRERANNILNIRSLLSLLLCLLQTFHYEHEPHRVVLPRIASFLALELAAETINALVVLHELFDTVDE
jgi:hypothetical protein